MKDKNILRYEIYLAGKSLSPITRNNYIKTAKNFLKHTQKNPEQLTQNDIDQYIRHHIKTHTHNGNATRFRTLKYYTNYLQKNFEIPMFSPREVDKAVLNDEETKKLFKTVKHMSHRHQLIFYLEYDGIRRPREICDLRLNYRHRDILYYNGKTHNDHIILTERLMNAWDNYVTHERPEPQQPIHAPYLLLNINNNPGIRGTHLKSTFPISRVIKEISYEAEIEIPMGENPTNYLIKRTSITRQLKTCPDPKIIQLQAGHSNISQTMRYNRVSDDDRRKYFKTLEKGYRKGLSSNNTDVVLKTLPDLPQDLNKNIGKDNNSYSFSISFSFEVFNTTGAEKVQYYFISLNKPFLVVIIFCCTPEMPVGIIGTVVVYRLVCRYHGTPLLFSNISVFFLSTHLQISSLCTADMPTNVYSTTPKQDRREFL